jgi:peptidoglycan-associated lipoprotein
MENTMSIRPAVGPARLLLLSLLLVSVACGGKKPPVARPAPPPPESTTAEAPARPPAPPQPVAEPRVVPPEPVPSETIASASLDDLNRNSPLKPVFYELDSSDLSAAAQGILTEDANLLKRNTTWVVTIEGHCDERGTAEYNLALGERRAVAARAYLISLGISADRVKTVSYGKEFPFDPGHDEGAYSKNRRAHFVITAK